MGSLTVNRQDLFPPGTTVSAYASLGHGVPVAGPPFGVASASGVVPDSGELTLTGLTPAAEYILYAPSPDRYLRMLVGGQSGESIPPDGLPSGGTTGQLLAKTSDANGDAGWVDGVSDTDPRLSNQRAPTSASVTVAKLAGSLEAVLKGAAVHDGTNYPARPPFGSVEWIGPTDPGGLAEDGDTWVATS